RTCHRRSQQIFVFVNRPGLQSREDISRKELLTKILHNDFARTGFVSLVDNSFDIVSLPDVSDHPDHFIRVFFLHPWNDDGSIKTTRISKNDFFRHERSSRAGEPRRPAVNKEWLFEHACGFPPARK